MVDDGDAPVEEKSMWAGQQDDPEAQVSIIELPRLRITLRRREGRYYCDEYDGYALIDATALRGEDDDLDRRGDALNLVLRSRSDTWIYD